MTNIEDTGSSSKILYQSCRLCGSMWMRVVLRAKFGLETGFYFMTFGKKASLPALFIHFDNVGEVDCYCSKVVSLIR
jgi:hypothetical protein